MHALLVTCEVVSGRATPQLSLGSAQLFRCAIVNSHGHVLFDKFVRPKERVTDFRTCVSGIRPRNLKEGGKRVWELTVAVIV